jgi:leucyl aminopeptidase
MTYFKGTRFRCLFFISFLFLLPYFNVLASEASFKWITIDENSLDLTAKSLDGGIEEYETVGGISLIKVDKNSISNLSTLMHRNFNRCGGYFLHDNFEEGKKFLELREKYSLIERINFDNYKIDQEELIRPMIKQVNERKILGTIKKLSSFHNRYYQSETGVQSQNWLKTKWEGIVQNRSDAKVEFFSHSWKQPSIILTIEGSETPNEIVILGGHADSIAGWWGKINARAPGADDNASGIGTITEVLRILMDNGYVPKKTIKFIAYAAEEAGLLGSKEIASRMKNENKNIVGVMQLDMTNFKGSDLDIVMMDDYTNANQNRFIGNLIDEYVKVRWGYDSCGYACSDHASWTMQGFPASIPFEARKNDMNRRIHTSGDTLEISRNSASHASHFAKLALSYVVEMAE